MGLITTSVIFLVRSNPICQFEGRYKQGQCVSDSNSGALFRVSGRSSSLGNGCYYRLDVLKAGDLALEGKLNPFISLVMNDARDRPPKTLVPDIVSFDSAQDHQQSDCN